MTELFVLAKDWILKLASSVQLTDIADILLLSLIFYYCVKLIRQTRAYQTVKGIVLVAIVYFIVSALDMSATSYVLGQFFNNIIMVMVLLFQPEIRHVIEVVGRGAVSKLIFLVKSSETMNSESIDCATKIAKAVENMSSKKTGALIVLEGKSLLGDIINTGTIINSDISAAMLENLFFHNAPLHDGAVIIRDNRIYGAGCILPLTQNEVSANLGTRHRAGIGISEHNDVLVIIVSEETGKISIAQNGKINVGINIIELKERIISFLSNDEIKKEKTFSLSWGKNK